MDSVSFHFFRFSTGIYFIFWTVSPLLATTQQVLECGPQESSLEGQRCCSLCPPGDGVTKPCTLDNDTLCAPCSHGNSFSSMASHSQPCQACSVCPEHSRTLTPCNTSHDTECECESEKGYFYDGVMKLCKSCDPCPQGYGVKKQCTRLHKTVCSKCQEGSYLDRKNAISTCLRCSVCRPTEVTLQPCTAVQNTICVDIPYLLYDPSASSSTQVSSGDGKIHQKEMESIDIIPIFFCLILSFLVLGLVIWAIIRTRRLQEMKKKMKKKRTKNNSSHQTQRAVSSSEKKDEMEAHGLPLVAAAAGSSDELHRFRSATNNASHLPTDSVPVTNLTRYESLPGVRRLAVENLLQHSPESAFLYRNLAIQLGYSLDSFVFRDNPVEFETLLSNWAQSQTATVGLLSQALANIGRDDVFQVLYHPLQVQDLVPSRPSPEIV